VGAGDERAASDDDDEVDGEATKADSSVDTMLAQMLRDQCDSTPLPETAASSVEKMLTDMQKVKAPPSAKQKAKSDAKAASEAVAKAASEAARPPLVANAALIAPKPTGPPAKAVAAASKRLTTKQPPRPPISGLGKAAPLATPKFPPSIGSPPGPPSSQWEKILYNGCKILMHEKVHKLRVFPPTKTGRYERQFAYTPDKSNLDSVWANVIAYCSAPEIPLAHRL
jgi:hypothetical protein